MLDVRLEASEEDSLRISPRKERHLPLRTCVHQHSYMTSQAMQLKSHSKIFIYI